MSKRHADEAVASDPSGTPLPLTLQTATFLNNTGTHTNQRNTNKRLHLFSADQHASKTLGATNKSHGSMHRSKTHLENRQINEPKLYTENMNKLDGMKDSSSVRSHEVLLYDGISNSNSKHLVKTVLDMPIFITIEGYRVASYSINGEPHLCLPQLLHFIQQKFPLDKVIDTFEESATNFVPATPKQIEGLIKAIVLPQGATNCLMIKRSDAELICLGLYDQHSKDVWTDMENICSKEKSSSEKLTDEQQSKTRSVGKSDTDQSSERSGGDIVIIKQEQLKDPRSLRPEIDNQNQSQGSLDKDRINFTADRDDNDERKDHGQAVATLDLRKSQSPSDEHAKQINIESEDEADYTPGTSDVKPDVEIANKRLFESEAQDTILNLAKSVTSTLIIQVYHRCFGKCVGSYYPSMLKSSQSKCIECLSCHKMLTPRRFIGHTHGSKELNVCHWGFNSYHWRHYIRLSRKQTTNNLDDDELLVQFNTLKAIPDEVVDCESDHVGAGVDQLHVSDSDSSIQSPSVSGASRTVKHEFHIPSEQIERDRNISPLVKDFSARNSTNFSPIENLQLVPSYSGGLQTSLTDGAQHYVNTNESGIGFLVTNPMSTSSSHKTNELSSMANSHSSFINESLGDRSYPQLTPNDPHPTHQVSTMFHRLNPGDIDLTHFSYLDQLYSSLHANDSKNQPDISGALVTSLHQRSTPERLIHQDVFVTTSLGSYLAAKGIHPRVAKEIVDTTLGFIQRSRTLF